VFEGERNSRLDSTKSESTAQKKKALACQQKGEDRQCRTPVTNLMVTPPEALARAAIVKVKKGHIRKRSR
jgi:hypothetical protein